MRIFEFSVLVAMAAFLAGGLNTVAVTADEPNRQTFVLYDSLNVSSTLLHDNYKDLALITDHVAQNRTRRWCSLTQGAWFFYSETNFSTGSSYYGFAKTPYPVAPTATPGQAICMDLEPDVQIRSLRHITHADISRSAISFFRAPSSPSSVTPSTSGPWLTLNEELFFDGDALSLPEPLTFAAFGFASSQNMSATKNNWTVWASPGFVGESTCLTQPLDYTQGDWGRARPELAVLSFGFNVSMTVASIRAGCSGNEAFIQNPANASEGVLSIGGELQPGGRAIRERRPNTQADGGNVGAGATSYETERCHIILYTHEFGPATTQRDLEIHGNNQTELVLPTTVQVHGYKMSGNCTGPYERARHPCWGLYTGSDFGGEEFCVVDNHSYGNKEEGGGYILDKSVQVMSVKYGCNGGQCEINSGSMATRALATAGVWGNTTLFLILASFLVFVNSSLSKNK